MIYRVLIYSHKDEIIPELLKDCKTKKEANDYGVENAPLVYEIIEMEV